MCVVTDGANEVDGVVKELRVKGVVAVVKHVSDDLGLVGLASITVKGRRNQKNLKLLLQVKIMVGFLT